jgi:hypothetical protein
LIRSQVLGIIMRQDASKTVGSMHSSRLQGLNYSVKKSCFGNHEPVSDFDAANELIDAWLAYRDMAARLLVTSLNLDSPKDILNHEFRGRHELLGTGWCYRTHGIGVDMVRRNGKGGIDFDFSDSPGTIYADPDYWRLCIFMRRVVHDKHVDTSAYDFVIARPEDFKNIVTAALETRRYK